MEVTDNGLVLRWANYKEAHRILTVLTAEHGLITVKARSASRGKSPLLGAAQLFTFSEMSLFENKGRYTLNDARVISQFPGLSARLEAAALAAYVCEVLECEPENISAGDMLRLALNTLYALSEELYPDDRIKSAFELRYCLLAGYAPDLSICGGCGCSLEKVEVIFREQGIYCPSCASGKGDVGLSPSAVMAARHILESDLKKIFSFSIPQNAQDALSIFSQEWLLASLGRGFGTLEYYHKLFRIKGKYEAYPPEPVKGGKNV